jgi:hypothetical protein
VTENEEKFPGQKTSRNSPRSGPVNQFRKAEKAQKRNKNTKSKAIIPWLTEMGKHFD